MDAFTRVFESFEDVQKIVYDHGKIRVIYLDEQEGRPPTPSLHEAIGEVLSQIRWLFMPSDKVTFIVLRETVTTDQLELQPNGQ